MTPYYADDRVCLFLGDCREVTEWLAADVLVTDPPYGIGWQQGAIGTGRRRPGVSRYGRNEGIHGDKDTTARDMVLECWAPRPAIIFGALTMPPPLETGQVLVYRKPPDAGARGATGGYRRDLEAVYLVGPWPTGIGGRSSLLTTVTPCVGNPSGPAGRYGHAHAKPLDVMEALIDACPPGIIADPFAGSGSTLVAARNLGRKAIGVELVERYCEIAARRLAQDVLPLEAS
jgi:site-specific DNA-methyltransferase (adenine-specific)